MLGNHMYVLFWRLICSSSLYVFLQSVWSALICTSIVHSVSRACEPLRHIRRKSIATSSCSGSGCVLWVQSARTGKLRSYVTRCFSHPSDTTRRRVERINLVEAHWRRTTMIIVLFYKLPCSSRFMNKRYEVVSNYVILLFW